MRTIAVAALTTALASPAWAEDAPSIAPAGVAFQLGGGVTGFSRQEGRDMFRTGGYWDLRALWGSNSVLAGELSYRASTNNARPGLMSGAQLLGDGAEAVARINMPLPLERLRLVPFAFAGAGWTYYQVVEAPSSWPEDARRGSTLALPFGAGVTGVIEHVVIDARVTYRGAHFSQLFTAGGSRLALQSWSAGLTVGYEI
jgi:hypothetical protein